MPESRTFYSRTYPALFLIALTTLMYEILLTRVFSVTMWYHFAFMAISVAMFGMTAGAIVVFLVPAAFPATAVPERIAASALAYSLTLIASFAVCLQLDSIIWIYAVSALPFLFSGICVSLALTRNPERIGKLYAWDLTGAACGCLLLAGTLEILDAPTAVIFLASLASLAGFLFLPASGTSHLRKITIATALVLIACTAANSYFVAQGSPALRIKWSKGRSEPVPLYEKWNSFSRVRVIPDQATWPFAWGLSPIYPYKEKRVSELYLDIDAGAGTPLTFFNGNFENLDYLKYDITNLVHYIRKDARVFILGAGGGRDVLSALAFQQKSVVAVEVNRNILQAIHGKFGDFTGHLDRQPNVSFVCDEARSYLSRQRNQYDIIQASLVDTWAATAAGAFALTENAIYTLEAWRIFLQHLSPNGVITFSRWYDYNNPGEMYRLTALAASALRYEGVSDPRRHIVVLAGGISAIPVGNILVSRAPFTDSDLAVLKEAVTRMHFQALLAPDFAADPVFAEVTTEQEPVAFLESFHIDITPPTDNRPFFFNQLWLRDFLHFDKPGRENHGAYVLGKLLLLVTALTIACFLAPLFLAPRRVKLSGAGLPLSYFACIGLAFMMVEISQVQRLILFLGHPTYGLTVVLFSLLLSTGIGSHFVNPSSPAEGKRALLLLLGILVLFDLATPRILAAVGSSTTSVRILVAGILLFPPGYFMGKAFPFGMAAVSKNYAELTPWFWGINGATSVWASVLAVVIAVYFGFSATLWTGIVAYACGFLFYGRILNPIHPEPDTA